MNTQAPEMRIKFRVQDPFHRYVRNRVDRYLRMTGRERHGGHRMLAKSAWILTWLIASYILLVFFATTWPIVLLACFSAGVAAAAVGFNIQHDAGHRAYSDRGWINWMMASSLDLIGASSFIWNIKHNKLHHTYTNIDGHDDDINLGFLGRLSPHQPRFWFHRYQHYYLWFLYCFIAIKWHIWDDFRDVILGQIGTHKIARPKGRDLARFIGGKMLFFTVAFVIPGLMHSLWLVIGCYLLTMGITGLFIAVVFQLAHVVEPATTPEPAASGDMTQSWSVHQMETTVDFAQGNPFLTWLLGGLNYQAEHHLLPNVSHVHYPRIARIVENACKRFNVTYNVHPTFLAGLISHARHLRSLGRPTVA